MSLTGQFAVERHASAARHPRAAIGGGCNTPAEHGRCVWGWGSVIGDRKSVEGENARPQPIPLPRGEGEPLGAARSPLVTGRSSLVTFYDGAGERRNNRKRTRECRDRKAAWFRVTSGCLGRQRRELPVGVRIAKTPCGVFCGRDQQPRVARSSQLWAASWAPFGMPPELAARSKRPAADFADRRSLPFAVRAGRPPSGLGVPKLFSRWSLKSALICVICGSLTLPPSPAPADAGAPSPIRWARAASPLSRS